MINVKPKRHTPYWYKGSEKEYLDELFDGDCYHIETYIPSYTQAEESHLAFLETLKELDEERIDKLISSLHVDGARPQRRRLACR